MFKIYFFLLLTSYFLLFLPGCKKDLTPVDNTQPEINLAVEDVGVTEAWLRLNIQIPSSKSQITITRNNLTIQSRVTGPSALDTIIYDSGLLPNQEYTYTATLLTRNKQQASSIQITTMDTTSHDFTWELITYNSSRLNDVAIISKNEVWCVGEIYTEDTYTYDSLGNWIDPYNAVHWDGNEWELKRILYQGGFWEINTILAFNENDIWFEPFVHWDGNGFIEQPIPGVLQGKNVNKMWGTSSEDLYVVGNDGFIAHYNGQIWQRIESGIVVRINDIFGIYDDLKDEKYILCTASDLFDDNDEKIFRIKKDNSLEEINLPVRNPYPWIKPYSIWFKDQKKLFLAGNGLFERDYYGNWKERTDIPSNWFKTNIRGTDLNNIFVSQHGGDISHFNGVSWRSFSFADHGVLEAVAVTENLIVAVGSNASEALLIVGRNLN